MFLLILIYLQFICNFIKYLFGYYICSNDNNGSKIDIDKCIYCVQKHVITLKVVTMNILQQIKNFSPRNVALAAAIESAANSEDPIYRLKPSQVQERVQEALKKRES